MEFDTLKRKRSVVLAYDKTNKTQSYLRKYCYETKNHFQHFVSVDMLASTIDTLTLGDGKISVRIADPDKELSDVYPGIVDIVDEITSMEIADYDDENDNQVEGFMAMKQQKVVDHISELANTLCCKGLDGSYKHKATSGANWNFNFGTAIKKTASKKITASSTVLELSAQTEEQAKEMLDPPTSKEQVRILCSTEYYGIICKIADANSESVLVQQIDEPGIKINGWYYINDQATYKEVKTKDQTTGALVNAVPPNGSIMIDKSVKSKFLLCDLALKLTSKFTSENKEVVSGGGLPYMIAYDTKKGGLLLEATYICAPIAVPCLTKIVHGLAQC